MSRVDWVHDRLVRWADWSARGGLVRGLWYARCTFGAEPSGGGQMVDAAIDQEAMTTQSAVAKLAPAELRAAVHAFYCGRGTVKQRAKDLGVSEATLKRKVEHAHVRLVALLEEPKRWPASCTFAKGVDTVS